MSVVIAVVLLVLAVTAGGRKKKAPDDLRWVDRLEELDAIIDDD